MLERNVHLLPRLNLACFLDSHILSNGYVVVIECVCVWGGQCTVGCVYIHDQ